MKQKNHHWISLPFVFVATCFLLFVLPLPQSVLSYPGVPDGVSYSQVFQDTSHNYISASNTALYSTRNGALDVWILDNCGFLDSSNVLDTPSLTSSGSLSKLVFTGDGSAGNLAFTADETTVYSFRILSDSSLNLLNSKSITEPAVGIVLGGNAVFITSSTKITKVPYNPTTGEFGTSTTATIPETGLTTSSLFYQIGSSSVFLLLQSGAIRKFTSTLVTTLFTPPVSLTGTTLASGNMVRLGVNVWQLDDSKSIIWWTLSTGGVLTYVKRIDYSPFVTSEPAILFVDLQVSSDSLYMYFSSYSNWYYATVDTTLKTLTFSQAGATTCCSGSAPTVLSPNGRNIYSVYSSYLFAWKGTGLPCGVFPDTSPSSSLSRTPSRSKSKSISSSRTRSASRTASRSRTKSVTASRSRVPSFSASRSRTPSRSASRTLTRSFSATPSLSSSVTASVSISPSASRAPDCPQCDSPIGNGIISLSFDPFTFTCPSSTTSSFGVLQITSTGLNTFTLSDVPFSTSCANVFEPEVQISISNFPLDSIFSVQGFNMDSVSQLTLSYTVSGGWVGSISFNVLQVPNFPALPFLSDSITLSQVQGFEDSLSGTFSLDPSGSSENPGFRSLEGDVTFTFDWVSGCLLTTSTSLLVGSWVTDDLDVGVPFTGDFTISECGVWTLSGTASYSLPGSEEAYLYTLDLEATFTVSTSTWSGTGSGEADIGPVSTTLDVIFDDVISSRVVTGVFTLETSSGQDFNVNAQIVYPNKECDPTSPVVVGVGWFSVKAFPYFLTSTYSIGGPDFPLGNVLLSCDGSAYWGFQTAVTIQGTPFSAAGLPTITLAGTIGFIIDLGCPPDFTNTDQYSLVVLNSGGRSYSFPNVRATECGADVIQATVFGNFGSPNGLLLMASYNFDTTEKAVRAVKTSLPSLATIINNLVTAGAGAFPASSVSILPPVTDFISNILDNTGLSQISVGFDLTSKVITSTLTINLFGVPVQCVLIYKTQEKIYAVGVGISSSASYTGKVGNLIQEMIKQLGLVNAEIVFTNGAAEFFLPVSGNEIELSGKGLVVSAEIDLANSALNLIPGFQQLFNGLGSFFPRPNANRLSVLITFQGDPFTLKVAILLSNGEINLTADGKWKLTYVSFVFIKTTDGISVGIEAGFRLTIPDTPEFVVDFIGVFTLDSSGVLKLEAVANSNQVWRPDRRVDIGLKFPWAITLGLNLVTGPSAIGFTGSLQFGQTIGTMAVYIDLVKVANSGFLFALQDFNLRSFLAVFGLTFPNDSLQAKILGSFSAGSFSVSLSAVGYTSATGAISIPQGFRLNAAKVNFFDLIKIIELKVAVIPSQGFSFKGVIEKVTWGPVQMTNPTDDKLGPSIDMAMTPTEQRVSASGRVKILNFFTAQGTLDIDAQRGLYSSSAQLTFGENCPTGPAITAGFSVLASFTPDWKKPSFEYGFAVNFQADFGTAIVCFIKEAMTSFLDVAKQAIAKLQDVIRWANNRLAEAQNAFNSALNRLYQPTAAELQLNGAIAQVRALEGRCNSYDCRWYKPWNCVARGGCYIALAIARGVLSGLSDAIAAARYAASLAVQAASSTVSLARNGLTYASQQLDQLNSRLSQIPGLSDGLAGSITSFANKALKVNNLSFSGKASASTNIEVSFALVADLVVFGNPTKFSTSVSIQIKPIIDKFINKVKDGWKSLTSFLSKRERLGRGEDNPLRGLSGELVLDTFSTDSYSLVYNGRNYFNKLPVLRHNIPWNDICNGGFDNLFNIDLSENSLTGGIDSCVWDLPSLTNLGLDDNEMNGKIEFPRKKMKGLISFSVSKNNFEEKLEVTGISNFGDLQSLDISQNKFTGPLSVFKNLKKIQLLYIHKNQLTEDKEYQLGNLLLDIPDVRTIIYGGNNFETKIPHQPFPYKLQGQIQVQLNYNYFCSEVNLEDRWDNCLYSYLHNKGLIKDFEESISKWIQEKWEKEFESSNSLLSKLDPKDGITKIKSVLPMKVDYSRDPEGGRHTVIDFVFTMPNPNTNKQEDGKAEEAEATRSFLRRMIKYMEEDFQELTFSTPWETLEYSEFSKRRSSLETKDKPLPEKTKTFLIKTRKFVLGCPAGWIGDDCQYFCEYGYTAHSRFVDQVTYEAYQNATELSWELMEFSGAAPTCALTPVLCESKKCNVAIYNVHKKCGVWIQDQCGDPTSFAGSESTPDRLANFQECEEAIADSQEHCTQEAYECSGTVTKKYQELVEEASNKKNYCPIFEKEEDVGRRRNSGGNAEDDIAGWMIALIVVACVFGAVVITLVAVFMLLWKK